MSKTVKELITESLSNTMTYQEFRDLVKDLAAKGQSTGPEHTEALTNYTVLNDRRMKRWDKTLKLNAEAIEKIRAYTQKVTWLVLTESWCGDAPPSMAVMDKITQLNPNISYKVLLRDENLAVMDCFLTNEGRSIPKLIVIDDETGEVIANWGPRSKAATQLVTDYKIAHGKLTPEFKEDLQLWYNKDKGQSVVKDLLELL